MVFQCRDEIGQEPPLQSKGRTQLAVRAKPRRLREANRNQRANPHPGPNAPPDAQKRKKRTHAAPLNFSANEERMREGRHDAVSEIEILYSGEMHEPKNSILMAAAGTARRRDHCLQATEPAEYIPEFKLKRSLCSLTSPRRSFTATGELSQLLPVLVDALDSV
jgi:hypothetical protein